MNKKISPTLIGAFVIGAIALLVIAIIVFGSGRLFRQTREFVLYFETSVNGLRVGAPVKFKGVEIGSVKNIVLQLEKDTQVARIPVIIEIDLEKLTARGAAGTIAEDPEAFRKAITDLGLRGQLLTGKPGHGIALRRPRFFSRDSGESRSANRQRSQISGNPNHTHYP